VVKIDDVLYEAPVYSDVPPVLALYHLGEPDELVAASVKLPDPQRSAAVVDCIVGILTTLATTAVLPTEVHPLLTACT
jgi:hypothetical protein